MASRRSFVKALSLSGAAAPLWKAANRLGFVPPGNVVVTPDDPRYSQLVFGNNKRFEAAPRAIHLCSDEAGIADALKAALTSSNRKITVRSGGHCYEDFVTDNQGGIICDVSGMKSIELESNGLYGVEAGCTIGDAVTQLYHKYGLMMPLGSCFSVGLGGHITGGGFGVTTRKFGLSSDYLQAVSLVYVDEHEQVVARTFNLGNPDERDVVWAHQGGGGGNFGIVTKFWFRDLPEAPGTVYQSGLSWNWEDLDYNHFRDILRAFSSFQEAHSGPGTPYSGLFTSLGLRHRAQGSLGSGAQYIGPHPEILDEFIDHMASNVQVAPSCGAPDGTVRRDNFAACTSTTPWFDLTLGQAGGGSGTTRNKYKSAYMKGIFPDQQIRAFYRHLSEGPMPEAEWLTILLDGYGGEVNKVAPEATAVAQRDSAFKLQYIMGWHGAALDAPNIAWLQQLYQDVYAATGGEPMPNEVQDGCYVNYCDADLVNWPYLYYKDNYPKLQQVKQRLDPHNIFHHKQSIALP